MAPPGTYSSYPATRQYPSTAHPLVVARPPSQLAATTQTDAADQDASKSFTELLGNGGLLFDLPTGDPEATMQSGSFGFPLSDVTEGLLYHDPPNLFSRNNVALPSPPQQQQLTIGPASNMLQSEPPRGPRGRPDRSFEVHTTSSRLPLPAGHSPPPPADPHPPTTNISFITETGQSRTGRKRPRRKPEDIDRAYVCGFEGCPKSYGQLSHLNQHVSLFRHGPQRKKEGKFALAPW